MLENLLSATLRQAPDRTLVEFHGESWSCRALEDAACRLAGGLTRSGMEPMDRVALLLPNCPETILAYLACFKAGYVIVPLDYRHQGPQLKYSLNHSGASMLIVHHERLAELQDQDVLAAVSRVVVVGSTETAPGENFGDLLRGEPAAMLPQQFRPDDLCMMIYTSGTTARPKGVTYSRGALEEGIHKYLSRVPMSGHDVALIAAPVTRPMALRAQLLPILYAGGCASLIERFEADAYVAALQRPPAKTLLALLPAAWGEVLRHPEIGNCDFRSLRMCLTGGDCTPPAVQQDFARITGMELTEQCGSSEAGPISMNPPFGRKKPGSIGLPMYGVQVCIVDSAGHDVAAGEIGNIVVRSSYMMDGYWNDTALTRKTIHHGAIQTGDLGRYDDDGYLWFMGRNRDLIVRGGSNVSPLEVEAVLRLHPAVRDACVVGVTHDRLGQEVQAFVMLAPGAAPSEQELMTFAATRLAQYMVPERIYVVAEMPLKGAGKIDRDKLKMRAETGLLDL